MQRRLRIDENNLSETEEPPDLSVQVLRACRIQLGHDVIVLDSLTYAGNIANLAPIKDSPRYQFAKGDIRDGSLVLGLLHAHKPDALVNFAAESHVDRSIIDASPFVSTNVGGTQVLLDAVRKCGNAIRFLQVSTDEVYGSADDRLPFTERITLKPSSPYAASKTSADLFVLCVSIIRSKWTRSLRAAPTITVRINFPKS